MGDPGASIASRFSDFFNPNKGAASNWFNSSGMTKPFNEQSRDKFGASTESFSDGDRNTTQENMSNEWKKKFPFYKG